MSEFLIKTATTDDVFRRRRQLAQSADRDQALPEKITITFEDPADMAILNARADKHVWSASGHRKVKPSVATSN